MSAWDFIKSQIVRARQDLKAAQVLAEWIGSDTEPVPPNLAASRAMQCINCPGRHNKFDHRRLEPAIAETIRVQEAMRRHVTLKTPQDARLHSCLDTAAGPGCGCYLKLKVWVPIENQPDTKMPAYCWVSREREKRSVPLEAMRPEPVVMAPVPVKTIAVPKPKGGRHVVSIRRWNSYGDIIMALPLADRLHEAGYEVHFDCADVHIPILRGHPSIAKVTSNKKAPVTIDLDSTYERNGQRKEKSVTWLFFEVANHQLKLAGLAPLDMRNDSPSLRCTDAEKFAMERRFADHPRPWVAMVVKSNAWPARSVKEENLVSAAKFIRGTCIWANVGPAPAGSNIVSARLLQFRDLIALFSVCDLVVTPDTGPLHVAAAVGCQIVALEQSIPIGLRLTDHTDHSVLSADVPCIRCGEFTCPKDPAKPPCQKFDGAVIAAEVNRRLDGFGKVSVVIPAYEVKPRVAKAIKAVRSQAHEVIVAPDGSKAELSVKQDAVVQELPLPGKATGFGATCQRGANASVGEFILFLNDDCYLEPGAVAAMLKEMEAPDVGVVGCLLKYPDGTIQHGGTNRGPGARDFGHIDYKAVKPSIRKPTEMEFVTFAAALVRRRAFYEIHGFDEEFFIYCEDSDLCLRMRKNGWRVMYTPHAVGIHDESQTMTAQKGKNAADSRKIFNRKWGRYFEMNAPNTLGNFEYLKR